MFQLENVLETIYFLPEDGDVARTAWLERLSMPFEKWIQGYGFTMPEAFEIIGQHEAAGIPTHLLLDYSQSSSPTTRKLIQELLPKLKVGSLTLTTAGVGSRHTTQIFHTKGMVTSTASGKDYICWDGSVNFSASGWFQANIAREFTSDIYAQQFIDQFNRHRDWARANELHYQVSALSGDPVTAYFASITVEKILNDLRDKLVDSNLDLVNLTQDDMLKLGIDYGFNAYNAIISGPNLQLFIDSVFTSIVKGVELLACAENAPVYDQLYLGPS